MRLLNANKRDLYDPTFHQDDRTILPLIASAAFVRGPAPRNRRMPDGGPERHPPSP